MTTIDRTVTQEREKGLNKIRERYSKFGDKLVNYLCEKAFARGGLRMAIGKVVKPAPQDEERMHNAFVRFLTTQGVDAFFKRIEASERGQAAENKSGIPAESRDEVSDKRVLSLPKIMQPHARSKAVESPRPAEPPPAEPRPEPPEPVKAAVEGPWDGVERRCVTDRRCGRERRSGKDRRRRVEVVFKNRRFGTDRRSSIQRRSAKERRESPPPAGAIA